jgi:hypothetical protein
MRNLRSSLVSLSQSRSCEIVTHCDNQAENFGEQRTLVTPAFGSLADLWLAALSNQHLYQWLVRVRRIGTLSLDDNTL